MPVAGRLYADTAMNVSTSLVRTLYADLGQPSVAHTYGHAGDVLGEKSDGDKLIQDCLLRLHPEP